MILVMPQALSNLARVRLGPMERAVIAQPFGGRLSLRQDRPVRPHHGDPRCSPLVNDLTLTDLAPHCKILLRPWAPLARGPARIAMARVSSTQPAGRSRQWLDTVLGGQCMGRASSPPADGRGLLLLADPVEGGLALDTVGLEGLRLGFLTYQMRCLELEAEVPEYRDRPYASRSLSERWQEWREALSSFFGGRGAATRQPDLNTMAAS
jgi:hypothetical protein